MLATITSRRSAARTSLISVTERGWPTASVVSVLTDVPLAPEVAATARRTADGRIPVIYRLDMSNGTALFAAQDFQIRNRDVLYVSNAPLVDFQKFLNTVSNAAFSIIGIGNALN